LEQPHTEFDVEVDIEGSIVSAPPDYNSDQLYKSNLTFALFVFLICNLRNQCFLRRVVHSQSIFSIFLLYFLIRCYDRFMYPFYGLYGLLGNIIIIKIIIIIIIIQRQLRRQI
jgi:hypothetical protein